MEAEDIIYFKGKTVKLRKKDGYSLFGTIYDIKKDSLIFETDTARAIISLDSIESIVEARL